MTFLSAQTRRFADEYPKNGPESTTCITPCKETLRCMKADESGGTRNQDLHV